MDNKNAQSTLATSKSTSAGSGTAAASSINIDIIDAKDQIAVKGKKIVPVPQGCYGEMQPQGKGNEVGIVYAWGMRTCAHILVINSKTKHSILCHADSYTDLENENEGIPAWIRKVCPDKDYAHLKVEVGGSKENNKKYKYDVKAEKCIKSIFPEKDGVDHILVKNYHEGDYGIIIINTGKKILPSKGSDDVDMWGALETQLLILEQSKDELELRVRKYEPKIINDKRVPVSINNATLALTDSDFGFRYGSPEPTTPPSETEHSEILRNIDDLKSGDDDISQRINETKERLAKISQLIITPTPATSSMGIGVSTDTNSQINVTATVPAHSTLSNNAPAVQIGETHDHKSDASHKAPTTSFNTSTAMDSKSASHGKAAPALSKATASDSLKLDSKNRSLSTAHNSSNSSSDEDKEVTFPEDYEARSKAQPTPKHKIDIKAEDTANPSKNSLTVSNTQADTKVASKTQPKFSSTVVLGNHQNDSKTTAHASQRAKGTSHSASFKPQVSRHVQQKIDNKTIASEILKIKKHNAEGTSPSPEDINKTIRALGLDETSGTASKHSIKEAERRKKEQVHKGLTWKS